MRHADHTAYAALLIRTSELKSLVNLIDSDELHKRNPLEAEYEMVVCFVVTFFLSASARFGRFDC